MGGFDSVAYLRRLGEDGRADRSHFAEAEPIDHAAAALVALGALGADAARDLLSECGRAPPAADDVFESNRAADPARGRPRVAALDADVPLPSGVLRLSHVRLTAEGAAIAARYGAHPEHRGRHRNWIRVPTGWPSGLPAPHLIDDRGTSAAMSFHGAGNDDRWRATLRTAAPIAPDTSWIGLYGARIDCVDDGPPVRISTERVPAADPAHAHLWRCLARSDPLFDRRPTPATVDALVASGALSPEDPVLQRIAAVRGRLPSPHMRQTRPRGHRELPDPWRSVIARRGLTDGPTGLLLVAAEVPDLDGHHAAVDVLDSGADGFTIATRESPGPGPGPRFRGPVEDREIVWWARDDRGNHYLAQRWGGEVRFTTALDPLATSLELMPSTGHERALISFPLRWTSHSAAA